MFITNYISNPLVLGLVCLVIPALAQTQSNADDHVVTVTGIGSIIGGNTLAARSKAVQDAMRNAVEQGLGILVSAETKVQNALLINDKILSKSQGYVRSYEVLSENVNGDQYGVTMKAIVSLNSLGNDLRALGVLQEAMGNPKIMVILDELFVNAGAITPVNTPAASAEIEARFLAKQFPLVDRQLAQQLRSEETTDMAALLEDMSVVTRLARKASEDYGAQILVLGIDKIEYLGGEAGRHTCQANIDVKIVDSSTAALIGRTNDTQPGANISPISASATAGKRVGALVADKLIGQITQYWGQKANTGIDYVVRLYDVKSYSTVGRQFLEMLVGINGVVSANRRSYDRQTGRLEVDVSYKGRLEDLLEAIYSGAAKIPVLSGIEEESSKGNSITMKLPN